VTDTVELLRRSPKFMPRARAELAELVAIRSFLPQECERAAKWVCDAFAAEGFADARLVTTADGSQAVVGSRRCHDPAAPTVLLYAHYDVRPPLDELAWHTPPFELTEVDGRWYGRGAADCKGNILAHLTALRALGDDLPVNLRVVVEEQGTGGLADFVRHHAEEFRADAILVCDTGNAEAGKPAVTVSLRGMVEVVVTVETLAARLHSGMFGGPTPDALSALVSMLATLHDRDGNTTVAGLAGDQIWFGEQYPPGRFRRDAGMLPGVGIVGGAGVADSLWARPALSILGIDCPPVAGAAAAIAPVAAARLNLRIPPGTDVATAESALTSHLRAAAPWGARVSVRTEATGEPFLASVDGPAYRAVGAAMREVYGTPVAMLGQGGSIPLCAVLADTYPDAEIILMGVGEPSTAVHAPNESVDPGELVAMATAEAVFLHRFSRA
jgi:cysteinylglycine-S-conjugate dipeptidase